VKGSKIESIAASAQGDQVSETSQAFAGSFVLPGLIDMHVHHPPAQAVLDTQLFALLFLAHGVTSVRDTGSFDGAIFETRRGIEQAQFPGPRIFACGPILDGDPPMWKASRVVTTPAEAKRAVEEARAAGADCVKIYSRMNREVLAAVRQAAVEQGLPLIGHVPFWVKFEDAHLDDVQHLTGVPESAPLWTWVNPNPFDWIAAVAADFQQTSTDRIELVVKTSAEQRIAHTPTLVMWDRLSRLVDYETQLRDPPPACCRGIGGSSCGNPSLGP
jgi:amidohydrolase family protein